MKVILILIIAVLIVVNLTCVFYGKKKLKNVNENGVVSEEDLKKGMRYMIFAAILSFVTIIGISIVTLVNLKI